jgi:predicted dehydrogenase
MTDPFTRRAFLGCAAAAISTASLPSQAANDPQMIRIGMIGLDTSHVTVFAKYFNAADGQHPELQNLRVTAAFPAGNPAFPLSKDRVEGFTKEVRELGVEIVPSLESLLPLVDAVLLESVDGSQHLEQAIPVFEARKPLFIDKPLAASLRDVLAISELGKKHNVPWFAASSSRFTPGYPELRNNERVGEILGCDAYSQSRAAIGHPDLFWYGVHGVDLLYSLMGTGCQSVTATQTRFSEQVSGTWNNGRIGTYRSIREHTGKTGLGATVFGTAGIVHVNNYYDYYPLVVAIAKFLRTRQSPIPVDEMVEVFAYMAAAEESKLRKGVPVTLSEVVETARPKR